MEKDYQKLKYQSNPEIKEQYKQRYQENRELRKNNLKKPIMRISK